ncbi:endonuclease/exonuclease/phosphatase family protein [Botrimarina hoheduenensis]|uniref:endonuclease/exonuclease/phosphatase family protein n=1 Tax=Botrimarina hoheduenensis TaxID=2528000 RepID=UPI0011B51732|nr:endonuclease/exonuclease/phosphatase family protein [Botrimarina hoheduenensis]
MALLAVLLGGGWSMISGLLPPEVRRVANTLGASVRGGFSGAVQQQSQPAYYAQPAPQQVALQGPVPNFQTPTPTVRIASFNIQTFGDAKAQKQYVMNAIASMVRMFDVIAIQEIRTQDDYFIDNFLRYYVNADGRSRYAASVSRRLGRTTSTERYAFLYNTQTIEANPQIDFVMNDPEDRLHRPPHVMMFRTRLAPPDQAFTFVLMNIHTDPDEAPQELDALYGAFQAVQRMDIGGATEDDVILLGDLNTNVPVSSAYRQDPAGRDLIPSDLHLLANVPGIYPLVRSGPTNTRGSRLHDNLLISRVATTEFTGTAGVYDYRRAIGLTEEQALEVSDHLPVWGEFSAYESHTIGTVAARR